MWTCSTRGRGVGSCSSSGSSSGGNSGNSARCSRGRGCRRARRDPHAGLSTRERIVLCGEWEQQCIHIFILWPNPGPAVPQFPRKLFERFFTQEVWDLFVTETNRCAAQHRQLASSLGRPRDDTSVVELKAFVGMQIVMGVCRLPRITMYW